MQTIPFTNHIGQVINPGDRVLAVTESTKNVQTRAGTYLGVSDSGNSVIVELLSKTYQYFFTDNGEITDWHTAYYNNGGRPYSTRAVDAPYKAALTCKRIFALR